MKINDDGIATHWTGLNPDAPVLIAWRGLVLQRMCFDRRVCDQDKIAYEAAARAVVAAMTEPFVGEWREVAS